MCFEIIFVKARFLGVYFPKDPSNNRAPRGALSLRERLCKGRIVMPLTLHLYHRPFELVSSFQQLILFVQLLFCVEPFSTSAIWKVKLDPMPAGGPYNITVICQAFTVVNTIYLVDVMFGDVWVCSGQSNMAFTVKQVYNSRLEEET